jgi:hypothetical protein
MQTAEFDNLSIRYNDKDSSRFIFEDIMSSIRGIDVDDILRNSPAFYEEMENEH